MGKDKIRKFKENETFRCLIQPPMDEVLHKDHPLKGRWGSEVFGNDRPIILELGCGKGEYTIALAERFPENNYIGVDIKGARLWKGAKYATEHALPNVAFLRTRIDFIDSLFGPGEVSEIWLTFSDPQPKKPNKRLSSPIFLERYSHFLKPPSRSSERAATPFCWPTTTSTAPAFPRGSRCCPSKPSTSRCSSPKASRSHT